MALSRTDPWVGWSLALAATVGSALVTPLARGAVVGGVDPISLLLARLLITMLLMTVTYALTSPHLLRINRRELANVTVVGVIAGVEICCFFASLAWIDASMSAMLKSVQPLVVLLLLALGGERLTRRHGVRLALAVAGIYLLVGPSGQVAPLGLLLTAFSVLLYALQLVLLQWRLMGFDSRRMTFYVLGIMTCVVAFWWWIQDIGWQDPGRQGWQAILVMAVVSTYFARLAQFVAIRIIGSGQIALLWPLQTLLIILLSVLFLQERMTGVQWLGGGLVLASAGLAVKLEQFKSKNYGVGHG